MPPLLFPFPLKPRSPFPSPFSSDDITTTFEVPADTAVKATQEQIDAYAKLLKKLPDASKKKLKKLQKEHGLTQDQLILAALKKWAPQYVGLFKAAMFFGIVKV